MHGLRQTATNPGLQRHRHTPALRTLHSRTEATTAVTETQAYITAEAGDTYWRYEVPTRTDAKVFLLTVGRVAVVGNWYGTLGENFVAWSPMLRRDKVAEANLGLLPQRSERG